MKANNPALRSSLLESTASNVVISAGAAAKTTSSDPTLSPLSLPTTPPYTRISLFDGCTNVGPNSPSVPLQLQPYIALADWKAFWVHLQPLCDDVARHTKFSNYLALGLLLVILACFIFLFWYNTNDLDNAAFLWFNVLLWLAFSLIMRILNLSTAQVRQLQLEQLRLACRPFELQWRLQVPIPNPNGIGNNVSGVVIDCEFEWWSGGREMSGMVLYFRPTVNPKVLQKHASLQHDDNHNENGRDIANVPAAARNNDKDNGYLCIPLFVAEPPTATCCASAPVVSMALLQSFDPLPITMDWFASGRVASVEEEQQQPQAQQSRSLAVAHEIWSTRFWPTMMRQSQEFLSSYEWHQGLNHGLYVLILVYVTFSIVQSHTSWMNDVAEFVFLSLALVAMVVLAILLWRSSQQQLDIANVRSNLVDEYASEFAAHGIFIEFRRQFVFRQWWWCGCAVGRGLTSLSAAQYLYVYPILPEPIYQAYPKEGETSDFGSVV